jgi:PAS domain S-box-containing protein
MMTDVESHGQSMSFEVAMEADGTYQAIFRDSQSVMLIVDPADGRILEANAAAARYYGHPLAVLASLSVFDLNALPPEAVREALRSARSGERNRFHLRHRLAGGELREVEVFSGPVRYRGRDCLHSVIHDIHEQRLAEQALRASEENYRRLAEQLGEGLVMFDREGRCRYCNRRAAELLGYRQEEVLGRHALEAVMPREREAARARMAARARGRSDQYEILLRRKDGAPVSCWVTASPLFDAAGDYLGTLVLVTDITDRKRTEAVARQVHKSESLSLMASGIAHDFNNLFQAIQGQLELAIASPEAGKARACAEQALRILEEAADLSRKMLDYSGRGFRRASSVDLAALLAGRRDKLAGYLLPGVRFRMEVPGDLPPVAGDAEQILQVVSGFIANAAEAIEGSIGEVVLSVRAGAPEVPELTRGNWIEPPPQGEIVSLSVSDTGRGILSTHLERIFDPFFSTKAAGRGLGLSAAIGIIRNHGAGLQVSSSPSGSTFRVCFRVGTREPAPGPAPAGETRRDDAPAVLLVDDNEDLRDALAAGMRELLGWRVLTAADGTEAVALCRERGGEITLILMDAVMPGLSGIQAFERIREFLPGARAILCSGYGDEIGADAVERHGFASFLKKPFSFKELSAAVTKTLARP